MQAWNESYYGTIDADSLFDASTPAAQEYMLQFCDTLKQSPLVQDGTTWCWPEAFQEYLQREHSNHTMPIESK